MASELLGVAELMAKLEKLGNPREQAVVLRAATSDAAKQVTKRARGTISAISPGETPFHMTYKGRLVFQGFAARSVKSVVRMSRDKTRSFALIGVAKEAFYALSFFELGIPSRGWPARPWLVPAFKLSQSDQLKALTSGLRKRIEKIAQRKGIQ